MRIFRFTVRLLLTATVLLVGLAVTLFLYGSWYRGHIISGMCNNVDCLERTPSLSALAECLPPGATNIEYSVNHFLQYYEATFSCNEQEFLQWANDLGWDSDAIQRNRIGPLASMFYLPSPPEVPAKRDGYRLRTLSPYNNGGELEESRILVYDCLQNKAYLQLWLRDFRGGTPLNEVVLPKT